MHSVFSLLVLRIYILVFVHILSCLVISILFYFIYFIGKRLKKFSNNSIHSEKITSEVLNLFNLFLESIVISNTIHIFFGNFFVSLKSVKNVHGHRRILSTSIKTAGRHSTLNHAGRFARLFRQIFSPVARERRRHIFCRIL